MTRENHARKILVYVLCTRRPAIQSQKVEKSSSFHCSHSDEEQSAEVSSTDQWADNMLLSPLRGNMEEKVILALSDFPEFYNISRSLNSSNHKLTKWGYSPFVFLVCNMGAMIHLCFCLRHPFLPICFSSSLSHYLCPNLFYQSHLLLTVWLVLPVWSVKTDEPGPWLLPSVPRAPWIVQSLTLTMLPVRWLNPLVLLSPNFPLCLTLQCRPQLQHQSSQPQLLFSWLHHRFHKTQLHLVPVHKVQLHSSCASSHKV